MRIYALISIIMIGMFLFNGCNDHEPQYYKLHAFTDSQNQEIGGFFVLGCGGVYSETDLYWQVLVEIPDKGICYRKYLAEAVPIVYSDQCVLEVTIVRKVTNKTADYTQMGNYYAHKRLLIPESSVRHIQEIDLE